MKCLACDFGGSSVKYALVDNEANITKSGKLPAPLDSAEQFRDTVGTLYDRFRKEIDGITISLPGYIDPDKGFLCESGVYQPLYDKCIPDLLKSRCPVNITVENDGKCGAMSEAWHGALKDVNDGAVLILGSGVGGGIIKDRHIHRGKGFAAGELSYLITNPGSHTYMDMTVMHADMLGVTYKLCKLKNLDLSVQDSSAVVAAFDPAFAHCFPTFHEEPKKIKADGQQFFKWLDEGDPDAMRVYREFIGSLTIMIFNIQIVFAPERIVIGGGLSREQRIYKDIDDELQRYYAGCATASQMRSEIVQSAYLDECNLVGAAYNYFQRFGTNRTLRNL